MSRVLRPDYAQRFLLPPALDEWVPNDHPVRFVRDFVDALDLAELGIHEPKAIEGRPPYAPDLLLKVWLFGYMERIRSTRGLEKACLQVMPFLWLTGNLHPDHNTLWRFFNGNRKALPKLFKALVKAAAEAELIGFALHALDGTKMVAASSTDGALHRKAIEERLKHVDEFIAAYMQEVSSKADTGGEYKMPAAMQDADARRMRIRELLEKRIEDREDAPSTREPSQDREPQQEKGAALAPLLPMEPGSEVTTPLAEEKASSEPPRSTDDEPPQDGAPPAAQSPQGAAQGSSDPMLREAEAVKRELTSKLEVLDQLGVNHLNEKEPDARVMKCRGLHALGYNAQIAVDHDSDLIVACDVVAQQNDLAQMVPMLERVHETLGRVAKENVFDTGYANGEQFKSAEERAYSVIVGLREEPETKGDYSKAHFRYDVEKDVYVCPQGEQLVQIGRNKSHASQLHPDTIYWCGSTTCPVREQCTKDARGRKIRRPYGEDARERQVEKQRDPRMRILLGLRKEIVEHIFGIAKTIDGFRRFTVRGLEKANAQWAVVCTAINLRKLSAMATWKERSLVRLSLAAGAAATA